MTGTIADKLQGVLDAKNVIKQAIIDKGVAVQDNTTFLEYANLIRQINGDLPPQIIINSKLSGVTLSNGLSNIKGVGSGVSATEAGNPILDANVNILCVCAGEIIYEGKATILAKGGYIPFLKITYTPTDENKSRTGYLSVYLNNNNEITYTVIDKYTSLPIILDNLKTYSILLSHCIIFRNLSNNVLAGSSTINNSVLGLGSITSIILPTTLLSATSPNISVGSEIYEKISIPKVLQNKINNGDYPYVSISSTSFVGNETTITTFNKGNIVLTSENITFE